jgi:3',5'-nucleoside bisphosphate phosphatase
LQSGSFSRSSLQNDYFLPPLPTAVGTLPPMRARTEPLLAELHSHTQWSDGAYSIAQLVDIYGRRGFDVLCVTDHVVRSDDPWLSEEERARSGVGADAFGTYLTEIEREAERARGQYDLLLLPGLELTYNDLEADRAAHAVAVGLRAFVPVDHGIEGAMETATTAGAAIIAAHPFDNEPADSQSRLTRRFACDRDLRALAHRFELFNRTTLFGWVAESGLPAVATGDFHRLEHLAGWKTLVPCAKDPEAVVAYLRSALPVYLTRLGEQPVRLAA